MFRFRLRHVILMMTWAIVSGAILVAAFSAGWYGWWPVALAVRGPSTAAAIAGALLFPYARSRQ